MLKDAHNHLHYPCFKGKYETLFAQLNRLNISQSVVNATHPCDWEEVLHLTKFYPEQVIPALGIHPWKTQEVPKNWLLLLEALVKENPKLCIGECGLDKWIKNAHLSTQRLYFEQQLDLATRYNRPISIHCLQAWGSLLEILKKHPLPKRGVHIHSFGGSKEVLEQLLQLPCYFSFSGYFLHSRKQAVLELYKAIPQDRLLFETDAPDMLPPEEYNMYGTSNNNHPANLVPITQAFALKSKEEFVVLCQHTTANFDRYFLS